MSGAKGQDDTQSIPSHSTPERSSKAPLHYSITISDDQSEVEKVQERNLLALRDRNHYKRGINQALIDYQMQSTLLEQQNKKRLLMARQQQTAPESPVPIGKPHNMEDMDPVELQNYIERLQARAKQLGVGQKNQTTFRYQVLYRTWQESWVSTDEGSQLLFSLFFDPPQCVRGQGQAQVWRSSIPLDNFDLYLAENKDVSFIVYRTYKVDGGDRYEQIESIRPVSQNLIRSIATILQSRQEYASLLQVYQEKLELHAPYLFMYHNREDLDKIRNSLDPLALEQLVLFSSFMIQNHGSNYATADSLTSQGKISDEYIQYLFKPGDVLVQQCDNEYRGWVATSWPFRVSQRKVARHVAENLKKGGLRLPFGSRDVFKEMVNDMVLLQSWSIHAWHWDFDGNFQRRSDVLKFTIQIEENQTKRAKLTVDHENIKNQDGASQTETIEVAIEELKVFPLKYASSEIVNKLRRRGKIFWKCRVQQFISYQESEKDNMQNPVSFEAIYPIAVSSRCTVDTASNRTLIAVIGRRTLYD